MSLPPMNKYHQAGLILKTDTLKGFREMSFLTLKAFAVEMGMTPYHYEMRETGRWPVKHHMLKAALNIVRIHYLQAGLIP